MEIVSIIILMALALGLILYSAMPNKAGARDALKRRLEGRGGANDVDLLRSRARESATASMVRRATPMLNRIVMPMSGADLTLMREKLIRAGYRARNAQTMFLASKTAVLGLGVVVGFAIAVTAGFDMRGVLGITLLAGGIGFIGPGMWLDMMVKGRQDKIRRGLPDILDLLVVSVESGLALDAAIKRVGEEMSLVHPDLSDEFRIATMETQMGIPRGEALDNMANRAGLDELRSLVSVITQSERFGTSVSKALRNQGVAMRTKRRQQAEERAQKTAVKLMIPLVMFIFPAMGVVLAGPAAINLMEAFSNR